jgi:hypothetical protein
MSTDVYLLSIPLARHRSIVPRPRRSGAIFAESVVREPERALYSVTDMAPKALASAGTPHRLDPA